ncbi:hypothetical protein Lal_00008577 [Lupinus albus]|nr:hypothetical protein Lal_00008577 [Lupinus albus]
MGFVIDHVTHRTYKHRTDRQPSPTDEPEPTAKPNQPKSHAPSSSSAAMPTNQMIMDELVSLRGYITTRMDAFDTQSQQIHYELHRLSSRLGNMDIDEDSSEPEYTNQKYKGLCRYNRFPQSSMPPPGTSKSGNSESRSNDPSEQTRIEDKKKEERE